MIHNLSGGLQVAFVVLQSHNFCTFLMRLALAKVVMIHNLSGGLQVAFVVLQSQVLYGSNEVSLGKGRHDT